MNLGTKIRTILAIATSLNTALAVTDITEFGSPKLDMIYKIVSVALNFIIVACVTYFNNDYTEIAAEYTGEMRAAKAEEKGIYGEYFYQDPLEDFVEDEEEVKEVSQDE